MRHSCLAILAGKVQISFGLATHAVPEAAVIGILGDDGAGVDAFLTTAGGYFVGPGHEGTLPSVPLLTIGYLLDSKDSVARAALAGQIETRRRQGSSTLLASHDRELLRRLADEIWWIHEGRVFAQGDGGEVLAAYEQHTLQRLLNEPGISPANLPALRRGDGRAHLNSIQLIDREGAERSTFRSSERMTVLVAVVFRAAVEDPVVGIMIRSRVGMEVYGTNTELEGLRIGPCAAGDTRVVRFTFDCNLCPQIYTVTAASHDPDGVWHDWVEDAVAFTVADTRYTAGVANLRARVEIATGSRE